MPLTDRTQIYPIILKKYAEFVTDKEYIYKMLDDYKEYIFQFLLQTKKVTLNNLITFYLFPCKYKRFRNYMSKDKNPIIDPKAYFRLKVKLAKRNKDKLKDYSNNL